MRSLRRRQRLRAAPIEPVSFDALVSRDRMMCHLCLCVIADPAELSLDHLILVSRRGAFAEWNLMLAHNVCNTRRRDTPILPAETKDAALAYLAARQATYNQGVESA